MWCSLYDTLAQLPLLSTKAQLSEVKTFFRSDGAGHATPQVSIFPQTHGNSRLHENGVKQPATRVTLT